MELFEAFDILFDMVAGGFALVGVFLLLAALGLTLHFLRFKLRARDVQVLVAEHKEAPVASEPDSGQAIRSYQPVFELISSETMGKGSRPDSERSGAVRSLSSQIHRRNSYPIGTVWPGRYDPVSGDIRTARDLEVWPMMVTIMWIVGIAFIIVPRMGDGLGDDGAAYFLGGIGLAVIASGMVSAIRARQRRARALDVMALLADIEIAYDTHGDPYDLPVLRIAGGDYDRVESADVGIASFSRDDVGQVFRARFDPYTGQIDAGEGRFKAPQTAPAIIATGAIFLAIGAALKAGVF